MSIRLWISFCLFRQHAFVIPRPFVPLPFPLISLYNLLLYLSLASRYSPLGVLFGSTMSVSIDIVPLTSSLDMYGSPDKSNAFSLSGHISIALTSPFSVFERRRPARVHLQSVLLTFHGQTEVITSTLGYSPLSLCSISRELVPAEGLELTNDGHEDSDEPCHWNVVFDLPIPGWLPATHGFAAGELGARTRYFLRAVAKFLIIDEDRGGSSWSFTTFCAPFRPRLNSVETYKTIILRRFVEPPTDEPVDPEPINYLLNTSSALSSSKEEPQIPSNILSKLQVLASVPKYTDICDNRLQFTLRLRTKDLEDAECRRLQVTKFTIDVVQHELCRRALLASEYPSRYPVPPQELQPPNRPLFDAHLMSDLYRMGIYCASSRTATGIKCSSSLLPPSEPGVYNLGGDTHIFVEDAVKETPTWYTMETTIPFMHTLPSECGEEWHGASTLRPTTAGPLYEVSHSLKLTVHCEYAMPDSEEVASADLDFVIPLTMGRVAPPLPPRDIYPALFSSTHTRLPDGAYPPQPPLLPFGAANLPVYSQLYDSQGNRKIDTTPLPLYTPKPTASEECIVADPSLLPPSCSEKQAELDALTLF